MVLDDMHVRGRVDGRLTLINLTLSNLTLRSQQIKYRFREHHDERGTV